MKQLLVATIWMLYLCADVNALNLEGSIFERVGQEERIDPVLLYAVALVESAHGVGKGNVSPSQWAIRAADGAVYPRSEEAAQVELERLTTLFGDHVDVGLMQVNLRWNGHRVSSPKELLNPKVNLQIGARILVEAILSSPDDMEIGIGRYHTWSNVERARNYGQRVLAIWKNLVSN